MNHRSNLVNFNYNIKFSPSSDVYILTMEILITPIASFFQKNIVLMNLYRDNFSNLKNKQQLFHLPSNLYSINVSGGSRQLDGVTNEFTQFPYHGHIYSNNRSLPKNNHEAKSKNRGERIARKRDLIIGKHSRKQICKHTPFHVRSYLTIHHVCPDHHRYHHQLQAVAHNWESMGAKATGRETNEPRGWAGKEGGLGGWQCRRDEEGERRRDRLDLSDMEHGTMVLIAEISWRSLWQRATRLTRLVAEMVVVRKEEKEERERGKEKDRWERNGRCRRRERDGQICRTKFRVVGMDYGDNCDFLSATQTLRVCCEQRPESCLKIGSIFQSGEVWTWIISSFVRRSVNNSYCRWILAWQTWRFFVLGQILYYNLNVGILIFNFFFEGQERKQRDVNEVRDIRF